MSNITLPREVALQIREALMVATTPIPADRHTVKAASTALDAALAEPEKERAETGIPARGEIEVSTGKSYRTTEPPAKPEPVAWLRKDGLRFRGSIEPQDGSEVPLYTAPPAAAKPEPATVEQIDEEYIGPVIDARWHDFEAGFRAAERWHGITKEDKT